MFGAEVPGLNSRFRICFLIELQSILVKTSPLFIINTKTSQLSCCACDGYMRVGYIYLPQSSGFILIWASEEIRVICFCHFHMAVVYIVKDIHKSLCWKERRSDTYMISPINDTGENALRIVHVIASEIKGIKTQSMTFRSCLMLNSLR